MTEIASRPLERGDLIQMREWLELPHVREWWDEYDDVEGHYLPRIEGDDPCRVFLILLDGEPVGMIQTYLVGDDRDEWPSEIGSDEAGVDLFIGEAELIGSGLGPRAIRRFVEEIVFADARVTACIADPDARNTRSLRAFEKAGFERAGEFTRPDEPPQVLVRLRRDVVD